MKQESDIILALKPFLKVLDRLGISYYVGGSIASSTYGAFRATRDIDMELNLNPTHIDELVHSLKNEYYIDRDMILDAIKHKISFNLIHLKTMLKIDVFLLKERAFDQEAFRRKKENKIEESDRLTVFCLSPEDIILHKLEWYKEGNFVSERQWQDVAGVLKVQGDQLDKNYMKKWAKEIGVLDLLEKALQEVQ